MPMLRRNFAVAAVLLLLLPQTARAQSDLGTAAAFMRKAGDELAAIVGGANTTAQKRERLQPFIDRVVDVNDVARFCLGRYWRQATPEQQREYVQLFHSVLVKNVAARVGDYDHAEVKVIIGRPEQRDADVNVPTTVERTGNAPAQVTWVVHDDGGSFHIVDVVAEGTSMRITVRSDYNAFLTSHGDNIDALLNAMRQQVQS
jgi:phospholipid transport system substrate-binding protein